MLTRDKRFWLKVWPRGDCWEWRGPRNHKGYGLLGQSTYDSRSAHRYAFHQAKGLCPPHLQLDHICNHTWCVRPSHLIVTTARENLMRGNGCCAIHARKTHCKYGHAFTPENTYRNPKGRRGCRTCRRKDGQVRRASARVTQPRGLILAKAPACGAGELGSNPSRLI